MFRELKDRLEERKEKLQSTGDPESFEQYFRVENTIFKLPKKPTSFIISHQIANLGSSHSPAGELYRL